MAVVEGYDLRRSATAEHLARRIRQQVRACTRNAAAPDYEGLEYYTSHVSVLGTGNRLTGFDRHVAQVKRDEAQVAKAERLAREEAEADAKRKRDRT